MSFYLKSAIAAYNLPKVKDFAAKRSSNFEGPHWSPEEEKRQAQEEKNKIKEEEKKDYDKQYHIDHKEKRKAYSRQYNIDHKQYRKKYYIDNRRKLNGYDPNSPVDIVGRNYNTLVARHEKIYSNQ